VGKQCRERCSYPCPTHPVMPFCWTWWTLGLRPFLGPAPASPFKHLRSRPGVCVHAGGTTTCAPPSTRTSGRWRRTHASSSWFAPLSRRLLPTPPVLSSPPASSALPCSLSVPTLALASPKVPSSAVHVPPPQPPPPPTLHPEPLSPARCPRLAPSGPRSPRCSPAARTTRSRTTGTRGCAASSGSSSRMRYRAE
jgi:hypothetical protein